jgi:hypothetical protein
VGAAGVLARAGHAARHAGARVKFGRASIKERGWEII